MCGRFDQNENPRLYLNSIGWTDAALEYASQAEPRTNVPPGTYRPVLHVEDGRPRVDDLYWGYRSLWAARQEPVPGKKRIQVAINARVEKIEGAYWRPLLRAGRGIVCVSGWYEWTGPKGAREPWHIHRIDRAPLFLLALANFGSFKENKEESGFTLVTADSLGGMVDIHDRRPVAVSAEDARMWMAEDMPAAEAAHLARTALLDEDLFEWQKVTLA